MSSITFAWESYAAIDPRLDALLLLDRRRTSNHSRQRIALVYSIGPHYFAQFDGHHSGFYVNATNEMELPQPWLNKWLRDVTALMRWLKARESSEVCIRGSHSGRPPTAASSVQQCPKGECSTDGVSWHCGLFYSGVRSVED